MHQLAGEGTALAGEAGVQPSLGDALQLAKQVQLELLALIALPRGLFGSKATSVAVASKKPSLIYRVARGVLAVGLVLFGLEIVL